jgi:hypothetical protein
VSITKTQFKGLLYGIQKGALFFEHSNVLKIKVFIFKALYHPWGPEFKSWRERNVCSFLDFKLGSGRC